MSDKITWWPARMARDIIAPKIVLMRYDWPDGKRIYQIGIYDPSSEHHPWVDFDGGIAETPDLFVYADKIVQYINIPEDEEFTYGKDRKG